MEVQGYPLENDESIVDWINNNLELNNEKEEADWGGVLSKLQQESQVLHGKLQDDMNKIILAMPRTIREVDRLRSESSSLANRFQDVSKLVDESVLEDHYDDTNVNSLSLQQLSITKQNLSNVLLVLEKSTDWNRLVAQVEEHFESHNLPAVVEGLGQLRANKELLQDMPHPEVRETLVASMEQRLETLIGPGLREAIHIFLTSKDRDQGGASQSAEKRLAEFVKMFSNLGRLDFLCKEYASAFTHTAIDSMHADHSNGTSLHSYLSLVEDAFVVAFSVEADRAVKVFGKPLANKILILAIGEFFVQIGSVMESHLHAAHLYHDVGAFAEKNCKFADELLAIVRRVAGEPDVAHLREMIDDIVAPFAKLISDYGANVLRHFDDSKRKLYGLINKSNISNMLVDTGLVRVFDESIGDCNKLFGGVQLLSLLSSVNLFYEKFSSEALRVLQADLHIHGRRSSVVLSEKEFETHIFDSLRILCNVATFSQNLDEMVRHSFSGALVAMATDILNDIASEQHTSILGAIRKQQVSQAQHVQLQAFVENPHLFLDTSLRACRIAIEQLMSVAQKSAYWSMMGPIDKEWRELPKKKLWQIDNDSDIPETSSDEDKLSSFGGPLPSMSRVTKHLISLVELLEQFTDSSVSKFTLPNAQLLCNEDAQTVDTFLGMEIGSRMGQYQAAELEESDGDQTNELFSSTWLNVVSFGSSTLLLGSVMQISKLGKLGTAQLASDLRCFANTVSMISNEDQWINAFLAYMDHSIDTNNTLHVQVAKMLDAKKCE